jgi:hypothetical protein
MKVKEFGSDHGISPGNILASTWKRLRNLFYL